MNITFNVNEIETMLKGKTISHDGYFYCVKGTTVLVSKDQGWWDSVSLNEEKQETIMHKLSTLEKLSMQAAWISTTIGKIEVGQYISKLMSTHPQKVVRKDIDINKKITIYIKGNTLKDKRIYYSEVDASTKVDLLVNSVTLKPMYDLEV